MQVAILNPEVRNFLRSSLAAGRWSDGARMCYRMMRASLRGYSPKQKIDWVSSTPMRPAIPHFTQEGHRLAGLDLLFRDVDSQSKGIFRLAGGGYYSLEDVDSLPDQEDRAAYHRLYWVTRYACAAALGHDSALPALRKDWDDWYRARWQQQRISMAAYTISERICSLVEALFWLDRTLAADAAWLSRPMKKQIAEDAVTLAMRLETNLGVHNHLLNNARALYAASQALPEHASSSEWRSTAFALWDLYFPRLLLEDGTFDDQSSHYQLLLTRTALEYVLAARESAHPLPDKFESRIVSMFRLTDDLLRPDGTLPRFGDSSPDHIVEDLWGLLAAALHHGILEEPPRHRVQTPLTHYYCRGLSDIRLPGPAARDRGATKRAILYAHGGYGFLRSTDTGLEIAVHADPRSEARGHGNGGRGSFEVWLNGTVLIRQPGSFLNSAHPRFKWYRSGSAQNVTCLDGLTPGLDWETYRTLPEWYRPGGGQWEVEQDSLRFRYDSYLRRQPCPVVVQRCWRLASAGMLMFSERITSAADTDVAVDLESRICLGDAPWSRNNDDGVFDLSLQSVAARLTVHTRSAAQILQVPGYFVPEYGVEKPAWHVQLSGRLKTPIYWTLRLETLCAA